MYSPLHAKVEATITGIVHALKRTDIDTAKPAEKHRAPDCVWAALIFDLDRCEHGRHQGDVCGDCGGESLGNPHMPYGDVIGYGLHGEQIVMPDRQHKHDPAAWRRQTTEDGS
jgi:hypothetical protein